MVKDHGFSKAELIAAEELRKTSNPFRRVAALKEAIRIVSLRLMPNGKLLSYDDIAVIVLDEETFVLMLKYARIFVDSAKTVAKLSLNLFEAVNYLILGWYVVNQIYDNTLVGISLKTAEEGTALKELDPHLWRDTAKLLHVFGRFLPRREYPAIFEQVIALYTYGMETLPAEHRVRSSIEGEILLVQAEMGEKLDIQTVRRILEAAYGDFQENPHHIITIFTWFLVLDLPDQSLNRWIRKIIREMKPRDPKSRWIVLEKRLEQVLLPIAHWFTSRIGPMLIRQPLRTTIRNSIAAE